MSTGWMKVAGMGLLLAGGAAGAQVTSDTGTVNRIPKYSGANSITNSAITEVNGSVGIGTSSPDALFRVTGRSVVGSGPQWGTLGTLQLTDSFPTVAFHYSGNVIDYLQVSKQDNSHNTFKFRADNAGADGFAGIDVEGPAYFATAGSGNMGVGTANPQDKLHVVSPSLSEFGGTGMAYIGSNLNLQGTDSGRTVGNGPSLTFTLPANTDGGNPWQQARILASPDNTNNYDARGRLYLQVRDLYNLGTGTTWNWRTGMMIQSNGNVGVGTITPGAKLEVNGSLKLTAGSGAAVIFPDGTSQTTAYTGGSTGGGALASYPDITDSNGNVGMGTTSPSSPLQVVGSGSSVAAFGESSSTNGKQVRIGVNTDGNGYGSIQSLYQGHTFTPLLLNPSGGGIGIGTTTPQAMLDVAGVINGRNYGFLNFTASQWINIGTFTPGTQGATVRLTAFLHNGYNASNTQDSTYTLLFKASNNFSVDPNGFLGNGSWYAVGFNASVPNGSIKWVANAPGVNATSYTLYINAPSYALGSHYAVTVDQTSTWTNSGVPASDPGPASATVLIPSAEFDLPYGNVGIGTGAPGAKLEVNGGIKMTANSGGALTFPDGTTQNTAYTAGAAAAALTSVISVTGANVSVGTTTSQANLAVTGALSASQYTGGVFFRSNAGISTANANIDARLLHEGIVSGDGSGALPYGLNLSSLPWTYGQDPMTYHAGAHLFRVSGANTSESDVMVVNGTGVGIGTDSPGVKLEVNGNVKLTAGSGSSVTFQDGSIQSTAWNGTIGGQDYADTVDVAGAPGLYEPGDVLMIDSDSDRTFRKVAEPYSRMVAGVYSTKPGLVGHLESSRTTAQGVPLAMAGIVPAKVCAQNGPIHRGDLLVASSTPGYAMRGTDPALLTGAVIGKALAPLPSGKGLIEVLVALQ